MHAVRPGRAHVAALRRKLGITDREALAAPAQDLRRGRAATALPAVPLTGLVGRDRETREVVALLREHRLVTLTGPAGIGKTRLAAHLAIRHLDELPDGARPADLAPVDRTLVGDTLARALGVAPRPGFPVRDLLRDAAAGLRCLLLVDNCEHVIGEAAVRVVIDALDALAYLAAERGRPRHAAVLTGTAHAVRESAAPHMRPVPPPDDRLRRRLVRLLGPEAFDDAHREGESRSATDVLGH